jgi:hypothetical protein
MTDTYELRDSEIERMAAEFIAEDWEPDRYYRDMNLVAFARAIERAAIQQERERAARLCEEMARAWIARGQSENWEFRAHGAEECAAAIRAG